MSTTSNKAQSDPSAPVIRLEAVGLSYGKIRALDGITLDIPSGRMVGLIGPDAVSYTHLTLPTNREV